PDVELVIVGDGFGLWEFTQVDGSKKLDVLFGQFPAIFDAFKRVGETIRITLLPGNHDYELACYPVMVEQLAVYNIHLEQSSSITRELETRRLWIEHGNQHDSANRMPDYGNPHAQPIGYHITSKMVGGAGQLSARGRFNWLKDIQSVYPTEDVPHWVWSNYFYKEMSPLLRWLVLPFLMLFGLTVFVLIGVVLESMGVTDTNVFLNNRILESLGIFGGLLQLILTINAVILALGLVLAVPMFFVIRDLKRTARRFGLSMDPSELTGSKGDDYIDAAKAVFTDDPSVAVFVYGHTHAASVHRVEGNAVVNTGTWIKQFQRVSPIVGMLPKIYVPRYNISVFRIHEEDGQVVIAYEEVPKLPTSDLTLTQRLLTMRKCDPQIDSVPLRTVVRR
ncbi:MAG: phosphoesterase, partial [Deltaproteobacteria bacterium]